MALPDIRRGNRGVSSPFREMRQLQRQMDRLFDDFFMEPSLRPLDLLPEQEELGFVPACDVEETDSHYLRSFDLPGVKKEDVKIDLSGNQLTVSGERKEEEKGKRARRRYYGSFSRSFTLPGNVNADNIEANYHDGVLDIALPKTAVSPGKQIPIKEGKQIEAKAEKVA